MTGNSNSTYAEVLNELKLKIRQSKVQAALSVNKELLYTYWEIGFTIAKQEAKEGWGAGIVNALSKDLRTEFPEMQGISPRNLRYMREFALAYPCFPELKRPRVQKSEETVFSLKIKQVQFCKHHLQNCPGIIISH